MLGDRIRRLRLARGLTQAHLAERAGVSRQLVGAVEAGRHLPRVDAAAALARVLGASVESLLAPDRSTAAGVLRDPQDGELVRVARVGEQLVCVPARPAGESWAPADGVVRGGQVELLDAERPAAVVAGCEPAIGLISRLIEAEGPPGVLAAVAATAAAIRALTEGRAHAAVVHARAGHLPHPPIAARRWQVARWQVGLAAPPELPAGWPAEAIAGRLPVVQREPGAGAQSAFERARAATGRSEPAPGPRAAGHLEAASWAQRTGWAAVSIEPAAAATGLAFHALEEHVSELWVAGAHVDAPGVLRFIDELAGARLQRRLAAIGGYDLAGCGGELAA